MEYNCQIILFVGKTVVYQMNNNMRDFTTIIVSFLVEQSHASPKP